MAEDRAVYPKQSPWREAEEQSAHFERDHACAQERMSMGRLSAGIWAGQDGLQSLQPLECAGNWQSIFEAAAEPAEPPERMALDSTHVKAHRCAGGGRGGVGTGDWHHQGR